MSSQDIENRVSVNENEIDNINETLQRLEDKIDHNSNKLDDLTNGSLSKAIQKQNNKLIQEVIGLVNDEKDLRREIQKAQIKKENKEDKREFKSNENDKWRKLEKWQLLIGVLTSGIIYKLLDVFLSTGG